MYGDTEDIKRRKLNAGRTALAQVNVDLMVVCSLCKVIACIHLALLGTAQVPVFGSNHFEVLFCFNWNKQRFRPSS